MGRSHILSDEEFGTRQPGNDIALAIGNKDRGCRRQSALFEVIGQPSQIEPGEHDAGDVAIAILEALRKMYRPLVADRVDPIIPHRKLRLS
jgi:hypothetical protein